MHGLTQSASQSTSGQSSFLFAFGRTCFGKDVCSYNIEGFIPRSNHPQDPDARHFFLCCPGSEQYQLGHICGDWQVDRPHAVTGGRQSALASAANAGWRCQFEFEIGNVARSGAGPGRPRAAAARAAVAQRPQRIRRSFEKVMPKKRISFRIGKYFPFHAFSMQGWLVDMLVKQAFLKRGAGFVKNLSCQPSASQQ